LETRAKKYPLALPELGKLERKYLMEAFDSGWISSKGKFILEFEKGFANYIGRDHGISTSNGTTALHLALASLGIGPGDEVIVPDLSFVSPANMVRLSGARPVLADSNPYYWGVDVNTIEQCLTRKTRAVLVVHLYGHPVDLDPILELCNSRGLDLIEDCAEAHGAMYKGKKVGSFGRVSCFSFFGNKLLTTGEGGMCLTDDEALAEKMRLLRDHGADRNRQFWHPVIGFNYRMTNLQAAVGCAQLKSLPKRIRKYQRIGHAYTRRLDSSKFAPHPEMKWAECVFWMYTLLVVGINEKRRDRIIEQLKKDGIETRPIFYPISSLPPYQKERTNNTVAKSLSKRGISLPTYASLTNDDINYICDRLQAICS